MLSLLPQGRPLEFSKCTDDEVTRKIRVLQGRLNGVNLDILNEIRALLP